MTPPTRRWASSLLPVLAGSAVALGLAATAIGYALPTGRARVLGGNAPINPGFAERIDLTAHNSPTLVRNPSRPANLAVVDRIDTPQFSCALHVSVDAGASWSPVAIPFPAGDDEPPRCFAPDAAFGADGTLYVTFATLKGLGNVPNAGWLTRSTDGGHTLGPPQRMLGAFCFQVRVTTDPRRPGRLYLSWLQATETANFGFPTTGNPIMAARSDDGGATWTAPVRVSPAGRQRVLAPSVAVGPRGDLYLVYLDVGNDRLDYHGAHQGQGGPPDAGPWALIVARSADEGATWGETTVDAGIVPTERIVVFTPPSPSLAVDPRADRVYVGFHDGRLGEADVWVWTSSDGGTTFSSARRVNDTPRRDRTSQYLPKLAVAPGGRLDVVYYDRRADRENLRNEVSLQSSSDGGRTFSPRLRLSDRSFDSRIGLGRSRNLPDLGSRLALVSTAHRGLAVWPDTRSGTADTIKQDLGTAVIVFPARSRVRPALLMGGPALSVAAVALFVWWTRADRRDATGVAAVSARETPRSSP